MESLNSDQSLNDEGKAAINALAGNHEKVQVEEKKKKENAQSTEDEDDAIENEGKTNLSDDEEAQAAMAMTGVQNDPKPKQAKQEPKKEAKPEQKANTILEEQIEREGLQKEY